MNPIIVFISGAAGMLLGNFLLPVIATSDILIGNLVGYAAGILVMRFINK